MNNSLKCPHCGKKIEISEAFTHQLEEQILESVSTKHKVELENIQRTALEEANKNAEKNALKKFEKQLEFLKSEKDEETERNKKLLSQVDNLLNELKELRRKSEDQEFELKKKFLDEEDRIRNDAIKKEREKSDLNIMEMQKKLADTEQALIDAQAKAKQGSQQLQGEVLELDLEEKLRSSFVHDEVTGIGKGVQGADILQIVKNQSGKIAGIILWETKRAKWTPSWIAKLKEDGRKNDATMTVLVCENLPKDIDNFKVIDGVLVTSRSFSLSLSALLRRNLMLIAQAKSAAEHKDEMLEILYEYLQSDAFRNRFEAFTDGIKNMEEDLLTERRSLERIWKKRETELKRMSLNTSRMFGELQGILGKKLPDIAALKLEMGENDKD